MKHIIKSLSLMIILSLFISIVIWFFEFESNDTIRFLEGVTLGFLNIFYASISSVVYTLTFNIKFSGHIADYIIFYYSYEWLIIFIWQLIIDFLLLYTFYYFNKTRYIYTYAILIVILKIIFAYTFGIYLV